MGYSPHPTHTQRLLIISKVIELHAQLIIIISASFLVRTWSHIIRVVANAYPCYTNCDVRPSVLNVSHSAVMSERGEGAPLPPPPPFESEEATFYVIFILYFYNIIFLLLPTSLLAECINFEKHCFSINIVLDGDRRCYHPLHGGVLKTVAGQYPPANVPPVNIPP